MSPEPRRRRWPWFGGVALAVAIAANHLEPQVRRQRSQNAGAPTVALRAEGGVLAGHSTIGIDEAGGGTGGFLRFATLAEWDFDPQAPSPCPPAVAAWSGREAVCVGFMYPLEPGTQLRTFSLLRTTQTCCYGPRPQYNQYLLVEMRAPVKFERLRPVLVHGRFFADPQPNQGFIYRLEGTSCSPAGADEPEADPATSARATGLPVEARDASPLPALWTERGLMTGVLRVERDPQRWPEQGIAGLHDAVQGVPNGPETRVRGGRGPLLKPWHEGLLLAGYAYPVLRARRRAAVATTLP